MTEQIQWPSHYTAVDVVLIEATLKWIGERDYSQAALARLARIVFGRGGKTIA